MHGGGAIHISLIRNGSRRKAVYTALVMSDLSDYQTSEYQHTSLLPSPLYVPYSPPPGLPVRPSTLMPLPVQLLGEAGGS